MFREFLDEVLDPSLQPDVNPRYTIRDNKGNVISDDVQIEMKTPVIQNPTPLNRAYMNNLQGDVYTQDRYNALTYSGNNAMGLLLPLTSYETGKIVNIIAPTTLSNPTLNINGLGDRVINGRIESGKRYTLMYNGTSWDIINIRLVFGTFIPDGRLQNIETGFAPKLVIVYSTHNNNSSIASYDGSLNSRDNDIPRILTQAYASEYGALSDTGFSFQGDDNENPVYYIAIG